MEWVVEVMLQEPPADLLTFVVSLVRGLREFPPIVEAEPVVEQLLAGPQVELVSIGSALPPWNEEFPKTRWPQKTRSLFG